MSKQLLIYDELTPLSSERHRDWSVKADGHYAFARTANSVPLTAVEFPLAAREFPIVFAESNDEIIPLALMGVRPEQNLFIAEDGTTSAEYVPAFIRRYPFVFASSDEGKRLTLCIDENYAGCNQDGRGERLFDADGEQTTYLKGILKFQSDFQAHYARTRQFCQRLKEMELVEPMGARFKGPDGNPIGLTGFSSVDRKKLHALEGDKLEELSRTGELELAYVQLQSLANFPSLMSAAARAEAN